MAQEAPEGLDDIGHMPSLLNKSRDAGEMQDSYRRNLAASWVAQPGELKADDCVEDIFAGGDGWGSHLHNKGAVKNDEEDDQSHVDHSHLAPMDGRSPRSKSPRRLFGHGHHNRHHSNNKSMESKKGGGFGDWTTPSTGGLGKHGIFAGRSSLHQQARRVQEENLRMKKKKANEVDEFDNTYREDLRGWRINVDALA